ncbi:inositol-1-monophosphatase [Pseudoroseomonas rhizosphaerae]|uniref:Inositol-1-monophosphatase n=1 Tax=Teichococcus rhizosphaerae TaxID=1335062 RepID=A0A2C7ABD6_9PROT|nr:inositol monophosphatase family protein [Pseudoroseomonas rhizosphaerae]PHK95369.1 inositol-1-monophosphatase [Pseudoroseomonas rhizosphaerae]
MKRALPQGLGASLLAEIEATALELARLAGEQMAQALGHALVVEYKSDGAGHVSLRDPVSEVDRAVEVLMRARLAERFPGHDVLGEEMPDRPAFGSPFVWAVDPVDGTANFINGFPLFSGSVGVLLEGRPVAGAVWCASSHALRAAVYHAALGGGLSFEGEPVMRSHNPAIRRRLAGLANRAPDIPSAWEVRRTGSAAIECACIAAGLLEVARFEAPNAWDVAGGFALVQAAGGTIRSLGPQGWEAFEGFGGAEELAAWRRPVVLGRAEAVELLCAATG